jgi:hypothetical protein
MQTLRAKEDQNFWNFLFSIFFIIVMALGLWAMREMRGGYLTSVPPFDALLMAFAAFRITRLVVYDKITRWFRELFARKTEVVRDGTTFIQVTPYASGFAHTVYDLLNCPWCIGIWSSALVVFAYFVTDWAWSVIFFLAVAGAGSLIQVIANAIGWRAENLKLEAQEHNRDLRL